MQSIDRQSVTTLRMLSVAAIEKAKSGHPGFPLGVAPIMYTIWDRFLKYNPKNPSWHDRDRFILSAGHGSALLYSMLHIAGFDLSIDDLKNFRQWESKTPGHPEYGYTAGVEATTGPLGTGFATGVGMAIAETMLAAKYNKTNFNIVDHYTYGIVSDGDLMEGIASEAASLAGTLGLGKLIYIYDNNHITIEGNTDIAFTEDVKKRFDAYGWQTLVIDDAEDIDALCSAINAAKNEENKPSLILVRTHIGYGSPKVDSPSAHGEPLGTEGLEKTAEYFGVEKEDLFNVPLEVEEYFKKKNIDLEKNEINWNDSFKKYEKEFPELAKELKTRFNDEFYIDEESMEMLFNDTLSTSTREASGDVLQVISKSVPSLVGGSADLAPSNKTYIKEAGDFSKENRLGKNIHFGVREQAMTCITNGIALHGGFIPYAGTFLVFADFMRPGIRLASLMQSHSIFVLTHDSIAVGEDGPTHQPVEQIMSLRLIPNLRVFRPADALETIEAWRIAVNNKKPVAILLTRQKLPVLNEYKSAIKDGVKKGGYVIKSESGSLDVTLVATGSEVSLALQAQKELLADNIKARVVSLSSWDLFEEQSQEYKDSVLNQNKPILSIEAGSTMGWSRYTKNEEAIVGIDTFGASAPGQEVYEKFGFTVENIVKRVKKII